MLFKAKLFTGIQPTNLPHLGNYLGVIRNFKRLGCYDGSQTEPNVQSSEASGTINFFCIADMHCWISKLNQKQEQKDCYSNDEVVRSTAAALIACGIADNPNTIIFQQSKVLYHAQMMWLLSCFSPLSRLSDMTQWKAKSTDSNNSSNLGLFTYPVLQAADILLYGALNVPVGEDQVQHLELTRTLVKRLNDRIPKAELHLPIPQIVLAKPAYCTRIKSLREPTQKMSKSSASRMATIFLADSAKDVRAKIRKAVTDSEHSISYEPERRMALANLIKIYFSLEEEKQEDVEVEGEDEERALERMTRDQLTPHHDLCSFKKLLGDRLVTHLEPISERYKELMNDDRKIKEIEELLERGNAVANKAASQNWSHLEKYLLSPSSSTSSSTKTTTKLSSSFPPSSLSTADSKSTLISKS